MRRAKQAAPNPPGALRLLVLTPFPPTLDGAHGGSRVIAQFLLRMAERHDVALMCLRHPREPRVDPTLIQRLDRVVEVDREDASRSRQARALRAIRARLRLVAGTPLWASEVAVPAFREQLRALLREWRPNVVQIEYTAMATYLRDVADAGALAVLTDHDPGASVAEEVERASARRRLLYRLDVRAWRTYERKALRKADVAVVFTERDARVLAAQAPETPVVRIPFGTDFVERSFAATVGDHDVLFVGNFVHPPNVDAARRLLRDIFPRIRERNPYATLRIIGESPPPELFVGPDGGVVITGRVPDLVPYVERAAVVAAPIRFGGGMRVKVVEALAAGRPVVASSLAVEGLEVKDGVEFLTAETDEEFADQICRLLDDARLREQLAERARTWACENLTWKASIEARERLYERLRAGGSDTAWLGVAADGASAPRGETSRDGSDGPPEATFEPPGILAGEHLEHHRQRGEADGSGEDSSQHAGRAAEQL